jgi:hypothetical protein
MVSVNGPLDLAFSWKLTKTAKGKNGFACGANTMELNFNNNHAGAAYSPQPPL